MPNVLTNTEYEIIVDQMQPVVVDSIQKYVRGAELGKQFSKEQLNSLRYMVYIYNTIKEYTQGTYSTEGIYNFIDNTDVRNLYGKFLKLSKQI